MANHTTASFYGDSITSDARKRAFHKAKKISSANKREVDRFIANRIAKNSISDLRIAKYYSAFKRILELDGDFNIKTAGESEIDELLTAINDTSLSNATKTDYRQYLKTYLKFREGGELPKWARDIKAKVGEMKVLLPEDIPKAEEIEELINACNNERDRAFIKVLAEAGLRAGEMASLQIKHIEYDGSNYRIRVPTTKITKTGGRSVLIVESVGYLKSWLSAHPFKDEEDAPLWNSFKKGAGMKPMNYHAMTRMVQKRAKKAGLDPTKFNLHNFRHYAATQKAKWMTDQQMMQYFGWRKSDQAQRYTHLSGRDMDSAIMAHYGVEEAESTKKTPCPSCGMPNLVNAKQCSRCQHPLDLKTAVTAEEESRSMEERLKHLEEFIARMTSALEQNEKLADIYARIHPHRVKAAGEGVEVQEYDYKRVPRYVKKKLKEELGESQE